MAKKLTIKQRVKNYFTEKPKSDFWMWAFITVVIFRYVIPSTLMFLMFFQVGLAAPGADMSGAIEMATTNLVDGLMKPMEVLYEAGSNVAVNNPILSKVIFHGLGYLVYVIYLAMFILILNLLRYGISWFIRRASQKKNYSKKEIREGAYCTQCGKYIPKGEHFSREGHITISFFRLFEKNNWEHYFCSDKCDRKFSRTSQKGNKTQ